MKDYADQTKLLARQNEIDELSTRDIVRGITLILVAATMLYFAIHWNPTALDLWNMN